MNIDVIQLFGWLSSVIGISCGTVFTVMHFAYSDFETQRASDIYRHEIDKRLTAIESGLSNLDSKLDELLILNKKH